MADGFFSSKYGGDVTRGLRNLREETPRNREALVRAVMAPLTTQIKEELSHPGTGRVRWGRIKTRTRSGRRRSVTAKMIARAGRASAPGEPPAPDTGGLRGSVQDEFDRSTMRGRVGTNHKAAAALNFGTRRAGVNRRTVIAPRPFMEPALKKAQAAMTAAGLGALRLQLNRGQ
jgi:phage gpG-like protein